MKFFSFFSLNLIGSKVILYISMNTLARVSKIRQRIQQLANRRKSAEKLLLSHKELYKGVVVELFRTCGKIGCKCTKGQKHQCYQITASIEGKRRTQHLPRKHFLTATKLTDNYREFRQARARWVKINAKMLEMFNELEKDKTRVNY